MRNKNQQAIINCLLKINWELAVTLTFHYDITEARANKTLRRWWNEIDRYFYGNAVKRLAKRTKRACVIEKGKSGTNYHYYIHAKRPEDRDIIIEYFIIRHWPITNKTIFRYVVDLYNLPTTVQSF